jgi:hypothetical protein
MKSIPFGQTNVSIRYAILLQGYYRILKYLQETGRRKPMSAERNNEMNRRVFLAGTVATVGLAAVAGLAGCAPSDSTTESITEEPASAATGTHQTLSPSEAVWPVQEELEVHAAGEGQIAFVADLIKEDEIIATHDVDVVICGLGPAGDAAALSCAEQGLKTVVVEKQSRGNYHSATAGGFATKVHKHWGITYDYAEWMRDAMTDCAFQGSQSLYQNFIENCDEAVDWYISHFENQNLDDYPMTFNAGDFPDFRDPWDKTSLTRTWNTMFNLPYLPADLPDILAEIIQDAGGEIRFNTPASQLVSDDSGKVVGVIVKSEEGYERYLCSKGVVLATGGYEFNVEMLKERMRPRSVPGHWFTAAFGNTGDGHQMALSVGASEDDYPHAVMLDPVQLMPFLRINALGKRFTPEYEPYSHFALAIQSQPGGFDFHIVDGAALEKIDKIWTPSSSCYGPKEHWVAMSQSETALVADTLEELAELMEVPVDCFVESIRHWNEMAAAGKDTDFGFPGDMMTTIDTPPYYATKEYSSGLCTVSGILVNTDCQALDFNRNPIEGLYVIGITSGGMFFNTYPHNLNCVSHSRNYMMGYRVGKVLSAVN